MPTIDWHDTLAELIAHNSISSGDPAWDTGTRPVAEALANRLEDAGLTCALEPLATRDDKVNLIATTGGTASITNDSAGLVLAGHLDTVPFDPDGWSFDPFTLTAANERLYGLGSCDMKGFVAIAAAVASEYTANQLDRPLTLAFTADEESGMDGAQALTAAHQKLAPYCVIGEPTDLTPVRRHKGIFMETIETVGCAGHSSNPALGANAIDAMRVAMNAITELRAELAATPAPGFPVEHATLNLGAIHGGDSANRIPARCRLDIDLRFLPGEHIADHRRLLRQRVADAVATTDCAVEFSELFDGTPAFETPTDSPLVTACETQCGREAAAVDFGTEGAFYNRAGMASVILGPGSINQAHQPNEYLALAQITPMQRILHGLIQQFCID
ncbi:acetylornithine deacetylase [Salinisphaera orenii]|uniref:acetylornithine deacetylase n=1 Tax=Salinisphaera orenii TaxID=856731 RepID=UPI000DBE8AD4